MLLPLLMKIELNLVVEYPQTPRQWRTWIRIKLRIPEEKANHLLEENEFPQQSLLTKWQAEFTQTKGYSPDFIPALSRNLNGFLQWVYKNGSEPNWSKSD